MKSVAPFERHFFGLNAKQSLPELAKTTIEGI